jgi:hypothetical protein
MRSRVALIASLAAIGAAALMLTRCGSEPDGPSDRAATRPAGSSATQLSARERPRGVVEDCSTRSEGSFINPFSDPGNLIVGPLVLVGAGGTPEFVREFGGNKFPLLVKPGHRVTIAVPAGAHRGAALAYGPLPQGKVSLADAHRVVTFIACRRGELTAGAGKRNHGVALGGPNAKAGGRPRPFWSGGVLARSPRCVPLLVWINHESAPRRVVLPLGVSGCE